MTTLHGRLDLPEIWPHYETHTRVPLISISDSQRLPMAWANWAATIQHGLPERPAAAGSTVPTRLPRLSRSHLTGEARRSRHRDCPPRGLPLKIAAKVDRVDRDYFDEQIRPLLAQPHVEFIGEIGDTEKTAFLAGAHALLFPIDWPEPFGLVMIEAMACGVPVIAFNHGSVPEVIEDGLTGFIVEDMDAAVRAVGRLPTLSRVAVRTRFEERFTARRMAEDHVALYQWKLGFGALRNFVGHSAGTWSRRPYAACGE